MFVKDTTEHRYSDHLTPELAAGITHTFVVREPSAAIASHVAVKPDASCSDIGYENQYLLFALAWSLAGRAPVVLDSDLLVRAPAEAVAGLLRGDRPAVPAGGDALAGRRPAGVGSARAVWHVTAGRSTGFETARRGPCRWPATCATTTTTTGPTTTGCSTTPSPSPARRRLR